MNTVRRISSGRVTADFFTSSYRFSASIIVYKRRLVDVLGDRMTDYLDIVDVYISRINAPGDIIATYKRGHWSKMKSPSFYFLMRQKVYQKNAFIQFEMTSRYFFRSHLLKFKGN